MKFILSIFFSTIIFQTYSFDWQTRNDFTTKTEGYIVEKNGDTTYGLVKIKCNGFNEDVVVETKTEIIKISPILLKSIYKNNQTIIPLFLFDSTQLVYGIVVDTTQKFKIYQGYDCLSNNPAIISNPNKFGTTTTFGSIPMVSNGFLKTCFVVLETDSYDAVFYSGKMSKGGQNRALKKNFSDDPPVLQYLNTLENISFEDIPKIIEQVNLIHKE